ncbi:MAG: hypothetical protein PHQ66_02655 [Candidatus Nanoarchaeia archaeon]|nr:hypothetical protein [Candidatus Nanoarchaeia archaeon]MDD5357732.1 hypothetical protein [Candidatus Nanoarchaeia archaeon]MDD5588651.1 hypothetical protein [Candidatus Nanoarchaeia archaeon]
MTSEIIPRDRIPQEALRLINEISGINAVIPTMEEDPSIIEGYFEIERKKITTLGELYNYKNGLENALRNYSANPRVQGYLEELDYSKEVGKLNLIVSKLERESALGGKILKDVWNKCFDNGFNMDYQDDTGELLGEKESSLRISLYGDIDIKKVSIRYNIKGVSPSIVLKQNKPKFIEKIKGKKSGEITADVYKMVDDCKMGYQKGISLERVINVIDRCILENGFYSGGLKQFRKIILNLPSIMNKYLEDKLGER